LSFVPGLRISVISWLVILLKRIPFCVLFFPAGPPFPFCCLRSVKCVLLPIPPRFPPPLSTGRGHLKSRELFPPPLSPLSIDLEALSFVFFSRQAFRCKRDFPLPLIVPLLQLEKDSSAQSQQSGVRFFLFSLPVPSFVPTTPAVRRSVIFSFLLFLPARQKMA